MDDAESRREGCGLDRPDSHSEGCRRSTVDADTYDRQPGSHVNRTVRCNLESVNLVGRQSYGNSVSVPVNCEKSGTSKGS